MAAGDPYREDWERIERIADQISELWSRQDYLEGQAREIRWRIDSISYETDEEGNDVNEDTRNAYYSMLESVEREISEVQGMQEAASREAYGLAAAYREQAGQYTQRAAHTSQAQSQFQALEGFRFGASTAKAGASLAGQRTAYYEDHVAVLNDLAGAASMAAEGIFSGVSSGGIRDRGIFGGGERERYFSKDAEMGDQEESSDVGYQQSKSAGQSGFSDYLKVAHGSLDSSAVEASGGAENISVGRADAMLAAAWGVAEDDIRAYRQENDLVWVKDQGTVRLVPGSVVRENGGVEVVRDGDAGNVGRTVSNSMVPDRKVPRDLPATAYGFTIGEDGEQIYDSPMEMDRYLYASQGSAYTNFQGTCGLCSVANVMRLAGVNISEKDVIDYAANTFISTDPIKNKIPWANRLCSFNPLKPGASGGTNPQNRKDILEHFGISSGLFPVKMEGGIATGETLGNMADYVSEGRGVIISVHASILEPEIYKHDLDSDFHAVTVTSVTRNKEGDISGFYICDSNRGTSFYPAYKIQKALTGAEMNVTYSHIR